MASTLSGLSKKIVLDLLDDQPDLRADSLDWGMKAHLPPPTTPAVQPPRTATAPSTVAKSSAATRGKQNPLLSKKPMGKGQIFRNATTFKQLLAEYNKPHQAPLIKAGSVQDYMPTRRSGFTPEPVEHIELPLIPGKILRPS